MADDVSTGELNRRLDAHEKRSERAHEVLGDRITDLASHTVPLGEFQAAERSRAETALRLEREHDEDIHAVRSEIKEQIRQVREEIKESRERSNMTWGRWLGVLTVVAAFLAVFVTAWGSMRGAK